MEEKIFKAETMLEVLEKVQSEMGPDAVVLSVREIQSPAWSLHKKTMIEVKAAPAGTQGKPKTGAAPARPALPAAPKPASPKPAASPALVDDATTIEWLSDEENPEPKPVKKAARVEAPASKVPPARTEPVSQKIAPAAPASPARPAKEIAASPIPVKGIDLPASLLAYKAVLAEQDIDEGFLDRIFETATQSLSPLALKNVESIKKYLSKLLEAELRVSAPRDLKPPAPVICLVGASGSGKTSMAARLAIFYGTQLNKKVTWICSDVFRTGAIAEARTYTDALSMPLVVVYTPAELKQALQDAAGSDLTVVDMSGYNPLDEDQVAELGAFLTEIPNRCLLLVASASQKEKDLFQSAASFGIFGINGLVVTKMDETTTLGNIYNLAQKLQIPLTYFSTGKGTAGSLEVASAERLVSALFSRGVVQ